MKNAGVVLCAICLVFASALIFSGCENSRGSEKQPQTTDVSGAKYTVKEIPISPEEGWVTGDIAANEKTAFYVLAEERPMAEDMLKIKIYAHDWNASQEKPIYDYESDRGFYINELEAVSDCIFWVRAESGQIFIEKMDLLSGEIQIIEKYDDNMGDILLQTDGKYLTWYLISNENARVRGYDIQKKQLFNIVEAVSVSFPYGRANVVDGICSYVTEEEGMPQINIYDIKAARLLHEIELEQGAELFNIAADSKRCVYSLFHSGELDQRIFVYDYAGEKQTVFNEDQAMYVFSWHYAGDDLLFNERNSNSIVTEDIDTREKNVLLDEEEHLFVLSSITANGSYIVLDTAKKDTPVLTLMQNVL